MDDVAIADYIVETLPGVDLVVAPAGDRFFYVDPDRAVDPSRRLPFATIVTSDAYDQFSALDRPAVFRVNVGVGRETFRRLFGTASASTDEGGGTDRGHDFAALDQLLPHPVYGTMFWVCVLNPSDATFQTLRPLLAEAYDLSLQRTTRAHRRTGPSREL